MPTETTGQRIVQDFLLHRSMAHGWSNLAKRIDAAIAEALAKAELDRLANIITRSGMTAQEFALAMNEYDPDICREGFHRFKDFRPTKPGELQPDDWRCLQCGRTRAEISACQPSAIDAARAKAEEKRP